MNTRTLNSLITIMPTYRSSLCAILACVLLAGCGPESQQNASQPPVEPAEQAPVVVDTVPPFVDITEQAGIGFVHDNGGSGRKYMPEIMGAGAAMLDADGDGDLDIYLVQGGPIDNAGLPATDRLLRNDLVRDAAGNTSLSFTDVTVAANIPAGGYGMGVASGDIDGDGNTDLYVTNFGANRLLRNAGDGTFIDVTEQSGTGNELWTVPATFFDMDGDGDLDLFAGSYVDFRLANHRDCFSSSGLPDYCSPHSYGAVTDHLYRNRGDGTFEDISGSSGIRQVASKALGVITGDFNNDSFTDLYVANDGVANQLWMNNADGTFEETALFAGCALNSEGLPEASMGVDAADVDGDGDEDLFMTHLRGETNTLYVNHGDGTFEDRTIRLGLAGPSIPYTGFGTAWFDVENDGKLDLLAVNGAVTVEEHLVQAGDAFPYHQPNQLFHNLSSGNEIRFEPYPGGDNDPLAASHVSRGAVFGDLDNDGDLDVLVANNSGPARLLLNQVGQDNNWLGIRLRLNENGADALGAAVRLQQPDGNTLLRRVRTAGSYVSANDPRLLFGLGEAAKDTEVEITVSWVGQGQERFGPLASGRYHEIIKGQGRAVDQAP